MTLEAKIREAREKAVIEVIIEISREYNKSDDDIVKMLMSEIGLSKEDAEEALVDYKPEK